jgi:hypothetical protein
MNTTNQLPVLHDEVKARLMLKLGPKAVKWPTITVLWEEGPVPALIKADVANLARYANDVVDDVRQEVDRSYSGNMDRTSADFRALMELMFAPGGKQGRKLKTKAVADESLPTVVRDYAKAKLEFEDKWESLITRLNALKAEQVTRTQIREKAAEEKERFFATPANLAAREMIAKEIRGATKSWVKEEAERVAASIRSVSATYLKDRSSPDQDALAFWQAKAGPRPVLEEWAKANNYQMPHDYRTRYVFDGVVKQWTAKMGFGAEQAKTTKNDLMDPDYAIHTGQEHARAVITGFIGKMQEKLGFVGGNIRAVRCGAVHQRAGKLESSMRIHLNEPDGAFFDVNSQVVYSTSVNGLVFGRFPTLFRNLSVDGGKIQHNAASEEEVNAWFKEITASQAAQTAAPGVSGRETATGKPPRAAPLLPAGSPTRLKL